METSPGLFGLGGGGESEQRRLFDLGGEERDGVHELAGRGERGPSALCSSDIL